MQARIITGVVALIWGGACYEAGKITQREHKENFTSQKVQIDHPQPKGIPQPPKESLPLTVSSTILDPFTTGLIQAPFRTISYPNFKILYSTYHKCPLAVYQRVTKQIAQGDAPRRPTFFVQPGVEQQFQSTNDHFIKSGAYKNFGYSRGHMAAAGNYSGNKDAKFQTFTYANVIPQDQFNNAGIWNTFERYSRDLAVNGKCQSVDIVSGPIYYKNNPYFSVEGEQPMKNVFKEQSIVLLQNGIVVPQKLYKLVQCNHQSGERYLNAFEFWNKKTFDNDKPLKDFIVPVESVEKQTGLKFGFGTKDPLTGKLILPPALAEFDPEGFERTKKTYDEKFYSRLMSQATTIDGMNSAFMRAKDQHIYIPLEEYGEQTKRIFEREVSDIASNYKANKSQTACQTLIKVMKMNKSLFYLRQMKPEYESEIQKLEDMGPLEECLAKVNVLREKKWEEFQFTQSEEQMKKEKVALNYVTYAVTKQLEKRQELLKKAAPAEQSKILSYVNDEKLKKFVVPVNIAVSLEGAQKLTEKKQ